MIKIPFVDMWMKNTLVILCMYLGFGYLDVPKQRIGRL